MPRSLVRRSACVAAAIAVAAVHALAGAQDDASASAKRDALRASAVATYARHVAAEYAALDEACQSLRSAVRDFCAAPSDAGLARARDAWTAGRQIYGRTEAFRFGDGPIDAKRGGVETFVNAWPVDESYIDAVDASGAGGMIGNPTKYPVFAAELLRVHNQRGGETNICTGWHAIEFMLWGQDRSERGPGARPARDFVDDQAPFAERRREYLLAVVDLLCDDIGKVAKAWREDGGAYRTAFVKDTPRALRAMLTGPALLVSFELAGERLAVPCDTRDQEEEQSCFSDTTHLDFRADIRGVEAVLRGRGGPGMLEIVRAADAESAQRLDAALAAAVKAVDLLPVPFDHAIRSADGSPERAKLKDALVALESLGEQLARAGKVLGWTLPTEPHG